MVPSNMNTESAVAYSTGKIADLGGAIAQSVAYTKMAEAKVKVSENELQTAKTNAKSAKEVGKQNVKVEKVKLEVQKQIGKNAQDGYKFELEKHNNTHQLEVAKFEHKKNIDNKEVDNKFKTDKVVRVGMRTDNEKKAEELKFMRRENELRLKKMEMEFASSQTSSTNSNKPTSTKSSPTGSFFQSPKPTNVSDDEADNLSFIGRKQPLEDDKCVSAF